MTGSAAVTVLGTQVLAGSSLVYTGQFLDTSGNPIGASALTTVTLTICDTISRQVVNQVSAVNILNSGRGAVDSQGNLTLTLQSGDTVKLNPVTAQEMRSLIIEWTYQAGAMIGKHEVQFPVLAIAPG